MRLGLVGCGRWGVHILRDLRSLGCEVLVVARSQASVARARQGGAARIVQALEDLEGVDGVVVATTTSTHAEVVERALDLEVPVFVEKPLCPDPEQAARLARLAPELLFVMDKWRYHPGVQALAQIAQTGRLGPVRGLRTTRVGWGSKHDDVDSVWVLTPHDLSVALEVLGEVLPASAALAQTLDGRAVSLVGLMSNGLVWHALEVSERSPARVRRVELNCDEGVAVLGGAWDDYVSIYYSSAWSAFEEERVATAGELPLLAELRAFVSHVLGGPPPRSSAAEGARIVETVAQLRSLAGIA